MTDKTLIEFLQYASDYLDLAADRAKKLSWPGTEEECRKALSHVDLVLSEVESGRVIELEREGKTAGYGVKPVRSTAPATQEALL